MSKYLSKADIVSSILTTFEAKQPSYTYTAVSVIASIGISILYLWRYKKITSKIPHGYSGDMKFFLGILLVLNLWNLILSLKSTSVFDLVGLLRFLDSGETDYSLVNPGNHLKHEGSSTLNSLYLMKDAKFIFIIVVSMITNRILSVGGLRCLEYISFIANDQKTYAPAKKSHRKTVSFDENLMTYRYKEAFEEEEPVEDSVQDRLISLTLSKLAKDCAISQFFRSKRLHNCLIWIVVIFFGSLFALPETFQLSSSAVLYDSDPDVASSFKIKSDHIFFTLFLAFFIDTSSKIFQLMTDENAYHQFKCFPTLVSVVTKFIWFYICTILNFSLCAVVLSSDVFINLMHIVINDLALIVSIPRSPSTLDNYSPAPSYSTNYPIQLITSILINYLSHSSMVPAESDLSTCADVSCVQSNMLSIFVSSFYDLQLNVVNCWIVLNLFCFTILPSFMWMIVDFKINRLIRDGHGAMV